MVYIVLLIIIAMIVAWFASKSKSQNEDVEKKNEVADDCCGAHEVCEADSLLSSSDNIEYYNDEELDQYKGLAINDYTEEAIEEFRDVLYTLKDYEVAGWMKSIQLRRVNLPEIIREEALMIVGDIRNK